jgi:hypothetical protein
MNERMSVRVKGFPSWTGDADSPVVAWAGPGCIARVATVPELVRF